MLRYMLDTNICIYVINLVPAELAERFDAWSSAICISSITYGELCFGVEKSAQRARNAAVLDDFTSRLTVLGFTANAAAHFGDIRAHLKRAGIPCGPYDMQIGAHARSEGLTVVTNNRREFDRMPGVLVENWL
ncbi:MAG TPA: tRNA(fMet)-specific endonuclease VapC [Devosiaceae bacterium]|jgi:tRNA(fMet)-specific endonuclease VapC|nr:tRNA(fMet)-specific endonuclease VapC [Devosiaceae bacterium]